ncbi:MAG: TIR domain-containing protein [Planctomycetota bacterium]
MPFEVFIGSSLESLEYAKCLESVINQDLKSQGVVAKAWTKHQSDTDATGPVLNTLRDAVERCRLAIFFATPDVEITQRGDSDLTARSNIWLEIGMWLAFNDHPGVMILEPDWQQITMPTDLGFAPTIKFHMHNSTQQAVARLDHRKLARAKAPTQNTIMRYFRETKGAEGTVPLVDKIRRRVKQLKKSPSTRWEQIEDREQCYDVAGDMIQNARSYVYSCIAYEGERKKQDHPDGLLPHLLERQKTGSKIQMKRCINLGAEDLQEHAREILKTDCNIEVLDTYCQYIEAVVTEQRVLLTIPDKKTGAVHRGVHIESATMAALFRDWFDEILPAPRTLKLETEEYLDSYLAEERRKSGSRSEKCEACQ